MHRPTARHVASSPNNHSRTINANSPYHRPHRFTFDNNTTYYKPPTRSFKRLSHSLSASTGKFFSKGITTHPLLNKTKSQHLGWKVSKRHFFASTEATPNPNSMKFYPQNETILESGTVFYESGTQAYNSPLAKALFRVDGVQSVMLGTNFVTVSKYEDEDWFYIKPAIFQAMSNFFSSGQPAIKDVPQPEDTTISEDDDEVLSAIKEVLETRVRPVVQEDGGDIVFKGFENGIVLLKLQGACSTCPSSTITLKNGIENMMMHYIPEVEGVEQVKDELDEESERQFSKTMQQLHQNQ